MLCSESSTSVRSGLSVFVRVRESREGRTYEGAEPSGGDSGSEICRQIDEEQARFFDLAETFRCGIELIRSHRETQTCALLYLQRYAPS